MTAQLHDRRIAFLTANEGVEQVELTEPWEAVQRAGGTPVLVAPKVGTVQAFNHLDAGTRSMRPLPPRTPTPATSTGSYCQAGSPPDQLRIYADAVRFVKDFFEAGQPVAVICHGPWTSSRPVCSTAA